MIPLLLIVTASFHPPAPTVGDLITVDFPQAVVLDPSPQYDIVSQRGNRVVIRTFEPKPFAISGRTGGVVFRNMVVPMRSVLKPRDNLAPAPLKPPIAARYPALPFVVIALAAVLAAVAWAGVFVLNRRASPQRVIEPAVPPAERFRAAVTALRDDRRASRRWARLADATREYLAATSELSPDLTTRELLAKTAAWPPHSTISEILQQGDLEKFSPWGPRPADFNAVADRALELAA